MKKLIWTGVKLYFATNVVLAIHALWLEQMYTGEKIIDIAKEKAEDVDGFVEAVVEGAEWAMEMRRNGDWSLFHPIEFGKMYRERIKP